MHLLEGVHIHVHSKSVQGNFTNVCFRKQLYSSQQFSYRSEGLFPALISRLLKSHVLYLISMYKSETRCQRKKCCQCEQPAWSGGAQIHEQRKHHVGNVKVSMEAHIHTPSSMPTIPLDLPAAWQTSAMCLLQLRKCPGSAWGYLELHIALQQSLGMMTFFWATGLSWV